MNQRFKATSVLASAIVSSAMLSACAGGFEPANSSQPKPEETIESMLTLSPSANEECPDLTATYTCAVPVDSKNTDPNKTESVGFKLEQRSVGNHIQFVDQQSTSFVQYVFEKFLLDDGGLIVDGQVQDKTAKVRESMAILMNTVATPLVRQATAHLGLDLEKELGKIEIPVMKAGYVSSCQGGKLRAHYVVDKGAVKVAISKTAEGDLTVTSFELNDGAISKRTETCKFASKDVKTSTEILKDNVKTEATAQLAKVGAALNLGAPGTLVFEVTNKTEWTLKEPVVFRFDRRGYITERNMYDFKKAYLGEKDDFWFDDVDVVSEFKSIQIDTNNMKVVGVTNYGDTRVIGDILVEGERRIIHFTVPHEVKDQKIIFTK